jgi:hypothetical protein
VRIYASNINRRIWFVAAALLALAAAPRPAAAFDTGHHSDLTRDSMQVEGFGDTAIRVVQLQNWLVDYYSASPTSRVEDEANTLHFDNLFTPDQVRNCWGRFKVNAKAQVEAAARAGDRLKLLTILGMTFHAVQDFYSHSNWVELHPRASGGPYRTETYWGGPVPSNNLYTGKAFYYKGATPPSHIQNHGGYDSGINHDSYDRPRWDQAYVFAYVACREWLGAMKEWTNAAKPGFWDVAKAYTVSGRDKTKLDDDHWAAYRISEWISEKGEDGHWKGKGSGDRKNFLSFSARWALELDSIYVEQFKGSGSTLEQMSKGLHGNSPPTTTPPDVQPLGGIAARAVIVKTVMAREASDNDPEIDDEDNPADFYAKVTVNGQTFVETMQLDKASITPAWTTIKFVPVSLGAVPIKYELWDEDDNPDDHIDINPLPILRDLDFVLTVATQVCAGQVTGVHNSVATAFTSQGKGDSDRGIVQFYVTVADLARK